MLFCDATCSSATALRFATRHAIEAYRQLVEFEGSLIRKILGQEQDHQIDLATALGEEVPNVNARPQRRALRKRR